MKRAAPLWLLLGAVCLAPLVPAHPHFSKTVTAVPVKGLELKLQYVTLPYNDRHLTEAKDGFLFHLGRAKLDVMGEFTSGENKIAAGSYLLRARARTVDDWTLLLIREAEAGDPRNPDVSKAIVLDSKTYTGQAEVHHLDLDITGGHGATDGKLILQAAFGSRRVEGVATLPTPRS
ncbi:MAG: hypothetical protein AB1898_09145 [Acidobacteriota bacterium]